MCAAGYSESFRLVDADGATAGVHRYHHHHDDDQRTSGVIAVPNTPDGVTFLAGKPAPTYDNDASRAIISGDGKFVVYHHKTENLAISNRPPSSCPRPAATSSQVYRTNLTTGETVLVSVGTDGCYANGETTFPYTNDDGRFVVFMSFASNLVANDTNARSDIFLKDMNPNGATTRISQRQNGAQLSGPSNRPSINGAGTKIVFNSNASNVVAGDTNGQTDCFLYNVATGAAGIERISLGDNDQELNGYNFRCDIAGDADAVVWVSDATNVMTGVPGTPNRSVYVRDLAAGTTELISKTPTGSYPTKTSTRAAISANGQFVVYQSTVLRHPRRRSRHQHRRVPLRPRHQADRRSERHVRPAPGSPPHRPAASSMATADTWPSCRTQASS